jgi:hypothetical protein
VQKGVILEDPRISDDRRKLRLIGLACGSLMAVIATLRALAGNWLEGGVIALIACLSCGGAILVSRSRYMAVPGDTPLSRVSAVIVSALSLTAALVVVLIFGRAVVTGGIPARAAIVIGVLVLALVWLAVRILRRNTI